MKEKKLKDFCPRVKNVMSLSQQKLQCLLCYKKFSTKDETAEHMKARHRITLAGAIDKSMRRVFSWTLIILLFINFQCIQKYCWASWCVFQMLYRALYFICWNIVSKYILMFSNFIHFKELVMREWCLRLSILE